MTSHQRHTTPRTTIIGLLLLVAIVASACNEIPAEPITIDNQSDQTIIIMRVFETSESVKMEILPGRNGVDRSACVDPDLEAHLDIDVAVASRAGPFCQGDPVWMITQAQIDAVFPVEPVMIWNRSNEPLTIVAVGDGVESVYREVLSRRAATRDRAECVESDLEVRRLDNGAVVAFREGPFCQGDPVWVITQAEVDTAE